MSRPKILALDASTEACSAALQWGEARIERFELLPRGHAQRMLGMIDELLSEAGIVLTELDAIAFCRGPGAFTGVRIGAGVVQGLAFGADLPVAAVSTLAALAQGAVREHGAVRVLGAIDARMGEVYWGAYQAEQGLVEPVGDELICPPEAVPLPEGGDWVGAGSGWQTYGESLAARLGGAVAAILPAQLPRALDCLPLAEAMLARRLTVAAADALPVYLRDKVTN